MENLIHQHKLVASLNVSCGSPSSSHQHDKTSYQVLAGISERHEGQVSRVFSSVKVGSFWSRSCMHRKGGTVHSPSKIHDIDYEPTGKTPVRSEQDVPSKGAIENLCSMPMDTLIEEFRENHPYESVDEKGSRPSLIPRSPLV